MSQRPSGYERIERDAYETPQWVTLELVKHLRMNIHSILEPAAGTGKMVAALSNAGYEVTGSDIHPDGIDFLKMDHCRHDAIVTNPPYALAVEFIEHALRLTEYTGLVAMLLRTDFDHAMSRGHLFERPFHKKLVLRRRIKWFEHSTGQPSFNHAWFIWDWRFSGVPVLVYGPQNRSIQDADHIGAEAQVHSA